MESKKRTLIIICLFLVVFSLSIINAKSCDVQSSCNTANTVMKLSSTSNAHGALYNQGNHNNFLCCDFSGTHSNNGDNKIIGLSSTANAHAEIPTLSNYGTGVYFGDLKCSSKSGSCPTGYNIPMISLSSTTNAHVASFNSYPVKICCCAPGEWEWTGNYRCVGDIRQGEQRRTLCPSGYEYQWVDSACSSGQRCIGAGQCVDNCIFTSASWSKSSAVEGDSIQMILEGTNCNGKSVSFEIYEDDLVGDDYMTTISGVFDRGTWTAEWVEDVSSDPEYYFIAILDAYTAVTKQSGLLTVTTACGNGVITGTEICDDGTNNGEYGYCKDDCNGMGPYMGDGIINGPEECDDGNQDNNDGCSSIGLLETEVYWMDMDGNRVNEADFGDTIRMIITWAESGTFEIKENNLLFDDKIKIIEGVSIENDVVAEWTITQEDMDKADDYDEFYFKVDGGEKSEYLKINLRRNDDPTNITIISPECGSYFDESTEVIININVDDADDVIAGTISIDGSQVKTFSNDGASFSRIFDSSGNFQIVVETISDRGGRARSISNIMVLNKESGSYVDGKYVAACITKPKDFSYIDGGEVEFDASATRAVRITNKVLDLLVPDEGDIFSWYWKFLPEEVVRKFVNSSDLLAYKFTAEFPIAGDNSATLRVEIN